MQQFNLGTWLQDKSRKVVTRDGRTVRILDYNLKGDKHICIAVNDKNQESITTVDEDGHCLRYKTGWHESNFDLFFADEEEKLTEFEKELEMMMVSFSNGNLGSDVIKEMPKQKLHNYVHRLLDLARKELIEENKGALHCTAKSRFRKRLGAMMQYTEEEIESDNKLLDKAADELINLAYEAAAYDIAIETGKTWEESFAILESANSAYKNGKKDALKDLPKWKKAKECRTLPDDVVKINEDGKIIYSDTVLEGEYFIMLQSLKSLPKEE